GLAELRAAITAGTKARAYLMERQLISEAEADQVSQSMIEDALTRGFRGPCTNISFTEGSGPETLSIGASALKMRIGVESLIKTCDQRVNDIVAVEREIPNWQIVFALSEGEQSSGQLSEYEKLVLNFIDGKSTVEQIAELCRDSSLNLGRVLRSLVAKKVIQQKAASEPRAPSGILSGGAPMTAIPVGMAGAASAAKSAMVSNITPYHSSKQRDGGRSVVFIGLVALLAICIGIAVLVYNYSRKQDELRQNEEEIVQLIAGRQWVDARQKVGEMRKRVESDLSSSRVIAGLQQRVESAIEAEHTLILEAIKNEDFNLARSRIRSMPEVAALTQRLHDVEEDVRADSEALTQEVRARLTTGDITGAMAAVDAAQAHRSAGALSVLAKWRIETMEAAQSVAQPLHIRLSSLARVRQSRPDATLEARLVTLEGELQGRLKQLLEQLTQFEQRAQAGAYKEVQAELAQLRIGGVGAGADIEARAASAAAVAKTVGDRVESAINAAVDVIANGANSEALDAARNKLSVIKKTFSQLSEGNRIERLISTLASCAASNSRNAAERAEEMNSLAGQIPDTDTALIDALKARAQTFRILEAHARAALDHAHRLGRAGDWKGAVAALEVIVKRADWQQTLVVKEASVDLEDAKTKAARHVQLRAELQIALRRGDVAACDAIAREIGLAYLPLVITSMPIGAEVIGAHEKVLGVTPIVLDISADERVDLTLQIRHAGYAAVSVKGSNAEAGWRLAARLERTPMVKLDVGHPLTALPAVVRGALWLADRSHLVSLATPNSQAVTMAITGTAVLNEPVFAPVAAFGDGILLTTRERLAVRSDGKETQRFPLPVASDWVPLSYRSPLVLDRELLMVPGLDGRIWAIDRTDSRQLWRSPVGAPFAAQVILQGDMLLAAHSDGRLERLRAEDGHLEQVDTLSGPILAAWHDAGGLSGVCATQRWSWDGTVVKTEALPETSIAGGPGVAITAIGRILLRGPSAWSEVGRIEQVTQGKRIQAAMTWAGHAVVARGSVLQVFGPSSFVIDAGSDLLPPIIWNGNLVIVSIEGKVWIYQP
ncbi:MAG: hypothetical protein AAB263_00555, partial [Planctomycetota bacterium]